MVYGRRRGIWRLTGHDVDDIDGSDASEDGEDVGDVREDNADRACRSLEASGANQVEFCRKVLFARAHEVQRVSEWDVVEDYV